MELVHPNGNWTLIKEEGFSPVQITVAAVAACSGYVYQTLLEKKRIDINDLSIHTDYEQDQESAVHVLTKINVTFTVDLVDKSNQAKAEKTVHLVKDACPVAKSLDPSIEINEIVVFK
nr:OsmC family protein [Listeria monocytogenes]